MRNLDSVLKVKTFNKLYMVRILFGLVLLIFMILPVNMVMAQTTSDDISLSEEERQWILENPIVTATNNMDLVPLDFVREGRSMGFAIDYLNLVTTKVGLEIEYINNQSWEDLINKTKDQKIDITHSLMINSEREEFLNFTTPYLEIPIVNFGRMDSEKINNIDDLAGKRIGVIQGWAITDVYKTKYPDFTLVEYTAITDALKGLSLNEVDVVTGSEFTLDYYIAQNFLNDIGVIGNDFAFNTNNKVEHRLATRKGLPILRDILQKGIDAITVNEYKTISERWGIKTVSETEIDFTEEELKWISENPQIKVTNKMEMAPIDFVEGGKPAGFSIDYVNLVAQKAGLEIEYINGHSWDRLLSLLREKEIDVSHSLVQSPERQEYLEFTSPYLNLPWVYYGRVGSEPINSPKDLKGKKIGIVEGTMPWNLYIKEYPHLDLIPYKSSIQALNDLTRGIIDVHPQLFSISNYKIKRNLIEGVEVTGQRFFPVTSSNDQFRLAVRKDWPILRNILEKSMASITQEEFSRISDKWYTQIQHTINLGLTEEERTWLVANNKIRVSADKNGNAPLEFLDDNGNLSGISGDLLSVAADLLNIEIEIVESSSWHERLEQIRSNNVELITTIVNTEERQKDLIFTENYYSESRAVFAKKEAIYLATIESLNGYTIAQLKNDAATEYVKSNYPEIKVIEVDDLSDAIELVLSDQADAHIGVLSRTHHYLAEEGITKIGVVGETPLKAELAMGINKNEPLLASAMTKALNTIPEAEKQRIVQKWMAVQVVSKMDYILVLRIVIIAFLIIGIIVYWNNKLRQEVARRIETEKALKVEQEKTLEALKSNEQQMVELQFQRETIEQSAEAQAELMDNLEIMSSNLQAKNDLMTEIMNNTGHGIVVFSYELKLQAWNETFKEIMELEDREYEEGMELKTFFELNLDDETTYDLSIDDYIVELKDRVANRKECNEYTWDRVRSNGVTINTTQRIMEDGTVISTYKDVTLIREEELRIKEMALCDGLTGLANRRAFDVNMEKALHQFSQINAPFLLAYMDLDNFKGLNDTQGHNAGDAVLVHVANIINKHIRDNDVPARLGGDEFAIIFKNTDDIEAASKRLEEIIQEIKDTKELKGYNINVGASAGLAQCHDADISTNEMVEIADRALYQAKENGKGQVFRSLSA